MNITDITKKITAQSLNEGLKKRFGASINFENFSLEELQDARNKVRTTLFQYETNEGYNITETESYQKTKMFLDVLNAAINERPDIQEAAKPDFADIDDDGDKEEPMKKAAKDKAKKETKESVLREGEEDKAELVMAAKDMVNRLTSWMEDTAEMQTDTMLELADAIRDELGSEQSESFVGVIKPALEALYSSMEETRNSLNQGLGQLTGEEEMDTAMGSDEAEMEPTVDGEAGLDGEEDLAMDAGEDVPVDDEFAADEASAGGEADAGREQRESVQKNKKKV